MTGVIPYKIRTGHWLLPFIDKIIQFEFNGSEVTIVLYATMSELNLNTDMQVMKELGITSIDIETPVQTGHIGYLPVMSHTGDIYITLTIDYSKDQFLLYP